MTPAALARSEPPSGTKSFALIVDDPDEADPDAPKHVWVHGVLQDLPADWRAPGGHAVGRERLARARAAERIGTYPKKAAAPAQRRR